ncbi:transient receptor potential channel pyrexia-like isoform X2 [Scylla paramamosain]|uniref:transient receptor potential channel pyrexia-like isoform X2 n=1 Tax=Scylla paramamosain TaxID=85552 RepID=UPI00308374A7
MCAPRDLLRLLQEHYRALMTWPFFGKQCSAALECFRWHKADAQAELTLLPSTSPLGATLQDWRLVKDGAAMSRTQMDKDKFKPTETMPPIFVAIQSGDVEEVKDELMDDPETALSTRYAGALPIHMACHMRRLDMLNFLLQAGAKVDAMEGLGQTALHLAVFYAWHEGVETLLKYGASPNALCEPPPGVKGLKIETAMHMAVRRGDLPSTVLLLQHRPDLAQRDSDLCSVLHLAASSRNLEVVRQILKEKQINEVIRSKESKGNSVLHMALMTECDAVCEATIHDLVKELVQAGVNINHVNLQGESPLFFAAHHRLSHVVETLIGFGADVTVVTRSRQSLLHAACLQGCATSLGHILKTGQVQDLVTSCDNDGYAPFHYAVKSGSIDCCELLLTNGDHLTRLNKDGLTRCSVILRQLPSATQLLTRLFDNHVHLSNVPHHDPNFRVTFDYSVITLEEGIQSSLISELSSSRVEALLKHPLLESFLFLKWNRIKPFFYCTVLFYLLFLLLHTIFIVMTFGNSLWEWQENPNFYTVFLILHVTMFLLIMFPDLVIMFANLKKYLYQWETYTKIIALASSAFVLFSCFPSFKHIDSLPLHYRSMNTSRENSSEPSTDEMTETMMSPKVVRYAAAISAFFSWVEFMMLLGRFPSLGSYVLMFTRVARSIIKFLAAFSSFIIGFALSFMVLFPKKSEFNTLPLSFTKTLMMMIGEIEFSNLISDLDPLSGVFLVAFLFLVCILMTNLLIGLAVNDLPDLKRQGKIRRLSKQVSYLVSYERLMVVARSLFCFPRQLRILLTQRCKIPQSVDVFPNKSNGHSVSRSSPYPIPSETLQEAIMLGNEDSKIEFNTMEEEDTLPMQFRSFKIKYDRDRRQLHRRLAQLPDTITTDTMLKERLDRMEQMIQYQILHLSLQLQKHHSVCSNCQQHSPETQAQKEQWETVIPKNFQAINATQSCPIQSSVNNWLPGQEAQPLPAVQGAPQLIPGNMTLQTLSQQYSSMYEKQA